MIITRKAIPRRTVLRGLGASLALPLLDGMVPAFAAIRNTAAAPVKRLGVVYVPNGMMMNHWTPRTEGKGFEFRTVMKPLEPFRRHVQVLSGMHGVDGEGPHAPLFHALPDRRRGETRQWLGPVGRGLDGPARGPRPRTRDAARDARAGPRRPRLRGVVRRRLQLCVHEHHRVDERHHAAPDGERPAGGLRAPLRRQRKHRPGHPQGSAPEGRQPPRLRHRAGRRPVARARRRRPRQAGAVPRGRARHRAPHPDGGGAERARAAGGRSAGRDSGHVRRARQADVRPAGARLRDGSHARRHLHDGPRDHGPDVRRDRRARRPPPDLAPPARPRQAGQADEDQPVPRAALLGLPGPPGRHARTGTARCWTTR